MKDLSKYTFEELISFADEIESYLTNHSDGYIYICEIRSYGRNWIDKFVRNTYSLSKLTEEFDGEHGIVDIYSTNPNLSGIYNYGGVYYIESKEDYEKWSKHKSIKYLVDYITSEISEWENRHNVPFSARPIFPPSHTKEDLMKYQKLLDEYDMSFIPPKSCKSYSEE
jgi:hypothetical protein